MAVPGDASRAPSQDTRAVIPRFAKELIAGGLAGALGKSSVAPLERVKILVQTGRAPSNNVVEVLRYMYQSEGVAGFFRGNGASVVRIVPYAAFHFSTYEHYRSAIVAARARPPADGPPPVWVDLVAGSCAGGTAVAITYPLDLVRTRLAWQVEAAARHQRLSIAGTITAIVRHEGVLGLYRGSVPTLMGILPYSGIKFFTYQKLKRVWAARHGAALAPGERPPIHVTLASGGAAGLLAQTLTYPLDILRRRMQVAGLDGQGPAARSMAAHLDAIVARHGWWGLFRGVTLNYIKVVPSTAVGFTVYDYLKQALHLNNNL